MNYLAVCYHYIRPRKNAPFPKIVGNKMDAFHEHIQMLRKNYTIISPDDAYKFSYEKNFGVSNKYGLLFTFDDGLSDHYQAATVLAEYGIKAFFFIPTCALKDGRPANPTIIHYCIAHYGIKKFLAAYANALEEYDLSPTRYGIKCKESDSNSRMATSPIKNVLKYKLPHADSRRILLHIYKNLFLKDFPNALEIMHVTKKQIREMLGMGHSIGAHTHSHISIGATTLTPDEEKKELIEPKKHLEKSFGVAVDAFAYPFGRKKDCLSSRALASKTDEYKIAFSVESILNTEDTHPLELGRYSLMSTDTVVKLKKVLQGIISKCKTKN